MPTPRKSPVLHNLQGTKINYPTGAHESHIEGSKPRVPRWLTASARRKFVELSKELVKRQVATRGDADLLAMAATLWDRWKTANDHVIKEGAVITVQLYSKDGTPYTQEEISPWLKVAQASEKQFLAVLQQLGLSPMARDKIKVTKGNADAAEETIQEYGDRILGLDRSRIIPIKPGEDSNE